MRVGKGIGGEKQREEIKEREKEKEKKGRKKRKEDPKAFSSDLPAFWLSEFVGSRVKVSLIDEGYAPRNRDSSYFGLFPL